MSDASQNPGRRRSKSNLLVIGAPGLLLAACGTTTIAARQPASTTTTAPAISQTVLTVNPCSISRGIPSGGLVWVPTQLPALISPSLKGKVEFYSTGTRTVLAPAGWVCSALVAADGGMSVVVTPPGQSSTLGLSSPIYQSVSVSYDYTGHGPGMDQVCPYFPPPNPSTYFGCTTTKVAGETTSAVTPDILSISDPPGTSGRAKASQGVLLYPQVQDSAAVSINFAKETCTLTTQDLCPVILSDYEV